jgi:hypothetical protein
LGERVGWLVGWWWVWLSLWWMVMGLGVVSGVDGDGFVERGVSDLVGGVEH